MDPTNPLRLRGDFNDDCSTATLTNSNELALSERPDLKLAKAAESFAEARIEQRAQRGKFRCELRRTSGRQSNGIRLSVRTAVMTHSVHPHTSLLHSGVLS